LKSQPHPLYATISIDNYSGGLKATNHLIDMGCRKIAHISGPLEWWEARQRKRGWEDALVATGMEVNELHWSSGNWSSTSGEGAFLDLLEKCPQMDGLFAGNDQMALGALHAAHQRGIVIPRDLAVVGFDDLPEAAYFNPSLTTVRQELRQLGILAVKKVLQTICAEVPGTQAEELPDTLILQPELIIRDSSRRLQGSI
jgi:DNA-binding LacI/PurR family transcriptional regulator